MNHCVTEFGSHHSVEVCLVSNTKEDIKYLFVSSIYQAQGQIQAMRSTLWSQIPPKQTDSHYK